MNRRVVITGMGVCAPTGIGLSGFLDSLNIGRSGIRFHKDLADLNFGCHVAAKPTLNDELVNKYFSTLELRGLQATGLVYGVIAGVDAWKDAGLSIADKETPDWESGIIFGTGILGVDKFRESVYLVDAGKVRKLGSTSVIQTMASGISAHLGGLLGCGNQVSTNSSACTTGTEGLIIAFDRIKSGQAERMLSGSSSGSGPYVWGGFDAMRVLTRAFNDSPEKASRPMSATASGFVPGSGSGALVLESLESAKARGAKIYAEVLGGALNSGGQRAGGSMTAPNSNAVQRCIKQAVVNSGISSSEIDCINGHLTATTKDAAEIMNWSLALDRSGLDFPFINSFKSSLGHCLAAAGSLECVASILQLEHKRIFGNLNCEDVHPEILKVIASSRIPTKTINYQPKILAKASFGFGDVNACVIFKTFAE